MVFEDGYPISIMGIPNMHRVIITTRGYSFTIWRPCNALYYRMLIEEKNLASTNIPHLHCIIIARRSDASTIRRPCYAIHDFSMTPVGEKILTGTSIPYLHCNSPGSDAFAIWR